MIEPLIDASVLDDMTSMCVFEGNLQCVELQSAMTCLVDTLIPEKITHTTVKTHGFRGKLTDIPAKFECIMELYNVLWMMCIGNG